MTTAITLTTPTPVATTDLQYSADLLQTLPCGLFRAPLYRAAELLPELADLYETAPVEIPQDFEIDVKIHMLMRGQYPCIPNWHCDNVPRIEGRLRYDLAEPDPGMFVWISGPPQTQFLARELELDDAPGTHGDLADMLENRYPDAPRMTIGPNTWYRFDRLTPHRGRQVQESCWRIFARLTPKSITPQRPVLSQIRRHAQVYLPSNFHW